MLQAVKERFKVIMSALDVCHEILAVLSSMVLFPGLKHYKTLTLKRESISHVLPCSPATR